MIEVPEQFRPHIKVTYPENNHMIFEEWFTISYIGDEAKTEREYLPICWTSYYVNNSYGKRNMGELQSFVDSLDRSKKYFTIVQYDDGILTDLKDLDIKVFGMGGGHIDYPLPLITMPHPYNDIHNNSIYASYCGSDTHRIRESIKMHYSSDFLYVPDGRLSTSLFCNLLANSIFALCPRGYGKTSFRICEALQFGAIPVYISDEFIFPHNLDFSEFGVIVNENEIPSLIDILKSFTPEQIKAKQDRGREVYDQYFTFESNYKIILENAV